MTRERTHWDGCWQERTHHNCALVRIAALGLEFSAERKRREAAEALLLEWGKYWQDAGQNNLPEDLAAHFARYKD